MTTPEERREHWNRSVAHKIAHGLPAETDPAFLGWIEEWIAGEVNIQEVQRRYASLLHSRGQTNSAQPDVDLAVILEKLREQIPEIGDFASWRAGDRSRTTRAVDPSWDINEQLEERHE
jgi:hypothetical protein